MIDDETWKILESVEDNEFLDEEDRKIFEEYLKDPSAILLEMANITGNNVRIENRLPFSFYISTKDAVHGAHAIRAKILWNPSKSPESPDGSLKLHGDYAYTSGSHKYKPTEKELMVARNFFRKYKVIFAAIWEKKLTYDDVYDYFKGSMSFKELLTQFINVPEKGYYWINHCNNLEELEACVRRYKIFNMND